MKVNIVARPDHALQLFEGLIANKEIDDVIDLYTFYALRKGSILNKLFPNLKVAPRKSITLDSFTIASRLSILLLQKWGFNTRKNEIRLFSLLAPLNEISNCDLLHYWPFYCADKVREIKQNLHINTVAEYYDAEPTFANEIFDEEYERNDINEYNKRNLLINQTSCFEFETNFIVASEFTKNSYSKRFPDKKYHVCKYGPAGYQLKQHSKYYRQTSKRIVYVGQICVEKGVHYLLDAVKDMDVSLELIGPIRKGQEIFFTGLLKTLNNVVYHGAMRHSLVLQRLVNYDLFCLPSLSDNYSLAVVEALSNRIPVIISENCGNVEDIKEYNLGMVAKVKSSSSLRSCIETFDDIFNYEKFNMGLDNFFSIKNQLSYPKSVLEVYKKILSER